MGFRCFIPFGLSTSFPTYSRKGWDVILENLCLYDGQSLGALLSCPASRVIALNEAAVRKHKAAQRKHR